MLMTQAGVEQTPARAAQASSGSVGDVVAVQIWIEQSSNFVAEPPDVFHAEGVVADIRC